MPLKPKTIEKIYWTIGEVAEEIGVNTSSIRFWEKEFGTINPRRTNRGDRLYGRKEIEQLRTIQHLVKDKGEDDLCPSTTLQSWCCVANYRLRTMCWKTQCRM